LAVGLNRWIDKNAEILRLSFYVRLIVIGVTSCAVSERWCQSYG
jgi:hypothetical protein